MENEEFNRIVTSAIEECRGGGCDTFCKITGDPICPITIVLREVQVPLVWVQFWGNVKASHTPMREKLMEFFNEKQLDSLIRIENIYFNSKQVTERQKKKMFQILG